HFDQVCRHPDVELLESSFELFLEFQEELAMLRLVADVDEDADQIVAIRFPFLAPVSSDRLGFAGDSTEPLLQFEQGLGDDLVRDWLAVIEPEREQHLESPECFAHRSPVPRRGTKYLRRPDIPGLLPGPASRRSPSS